MSKGKREVEVAEPTRALRRAKRVNKQLKHVVAWVCGLLVVFLILLFSTPALLTSSKKGPRMKSVQDAKQIWYALYNFESEYGSYPNEATANLLREKFPNQARLLRTKSSNDFFRQLIVAGSIDTDELFDIDGADGQIDGSHMIESGECMYAYVVWEGELPEGAVLLMGPVKPGKTSLDDQFDDSPHRSSALSVVCFADGSIKCPPVDSDFFDWSQPHWGGKKPKIVWPE